MKTYQNILKKLDKNKKEKEGLVKGFNELLKDKTKTFEFRLNTWENSPSDLKLHYKKLPKMTPIIKHTFDQIRERLDDYSSNPRKIDLSIGLMDCIYVFRHNEYESEDIELSLHFLRTKKEFITFMEFVFKHNIGTYE